MASLWRLPILFAIEHNHYAQSTHWEFQHAGSLQRRPDAFGIPVLEVDGNDVEAVYATATECVEKLRSGQGPLSLFLNTYRLGPHSKGDDLRDPEELARRWGIEPLTRLRGTLDDDWCNAMNQQIAESLQETISRLLPERTHE